MPNSRYIAGRAYEYRVMKRLREEGYSETIRSAGSHGKFDVIGIDPVKKRIVLVQCKIGKTQKEAIKNVKATGIEKQFKGRYKVEVKIV